MNKLFCWPSTSNFKSFSRSLEHFFLTVGPNNFGNKIPLFSFFQSDLNVSGLQSLEKPCLTLYVRLFSIFCTSSRHTEIHGHSKTIREGFGSFMTSLKRFSVSLAMHKASPKKNLQCILTAYGYVYVVKESFSSD